VVWRSGSAGLFPLAPLGHLGFLEKVAVSVLPEAVQLIRPRLQRLQFPCLSLRRQSRYARQHRSEAPYAPIHS
jgi:hypothetical protein